MNIVFYGGHHWETGPWFRKQQFASRLAERGHKIFYIESSVSMLKKTSKHKNLYLKTQSKEINDNLFIISPSTLFPLPNNYYSRKLFNLKLLFDVKQILKREKVTEYLLWFNQLEFASILPIKNVKVVFDLADDRPFYNKLAGDEKGYRVTLNYVKHAFLKSDISIVSAVKIREKYQKFSKSDIAVVPNGHNFNLDKKPNLVTKKTMLKNIQSPIIGFIGTLFRFIDDNLLEYIISKRSSYNFVFIGPVETNFPIQKLKKYKNVSLLGQQKKELIPSYITDFDVCLNPFKVHEVNDSVSPVKVFEYLASEKPVLSTRMSSFSLALARSSFKRRRAAS